jgi:hypothetical protein
MLRSATGIHRRQSPRFTPARTCAKGPRPLDSIIARNESARNYWVFWFKDTQFPLRWCEGDSLLIHKPPFPDFTTRLQASSLLGFVRFSLFTHLSESPQNWQLVSDCNIRLLLRHGADAPEIVGSRVRHISEHQHSARTGDVGCLRHPVGRLQAEGMVQRVIRTDDAYVGE